MELRRQTLMDLHLYVGLIFLVVIHIILNLKWMVSTTRLLLRGR